MPDAPLNFSLPGNPTEAGPTGHMVEYRDWHEIEWEAIEELQFAMQRYGSRTKADVQMQRAVITKAVNLLIDADVILKGMEAIRG